MFNEAGGGTAYCSAAGLQATVCLCLCLRLSLSPSLSPCLLLIRNTGTRDPGNSQVITKLTWEFQAEFTEPVFLFQRLTAQHVYL